MREYLLLKRHSLADWRTLAETTHSTQYARLLRQADTHHDNLPPADHPSDSITYIGTAVLNLALAHLLSGEPQYLETARAWIQAAIAYPHWGKERMPDHDLDAAWLLFGLGLGYDWLKDRLPPAERHALREKLYLHGGRLYDYAVATEGRWWSSAYWQNHNWICYGGLAAAAYALCAEYSEAGSWAARARENFVQALSLMPEDGSNYEGPVYWRYGVIWFLIYADLLQQETGEDLHDSAFLRNSFFYRLYLSGPNLVDTANFGDCHDRRSAHTAAVYARLAGLYQYRRSAMAIPPLRRNRRMGTRRRRGSGQTRAVGGIRTGVSLVRRGCRPKPNREPAAQPRISRPRTGGDAQLMG